MSFLIRAAHSPDDLYIIKQLFQEYGDSLGIDLGFQGFEQELEGLPGAYAGPRGRLVLAWKDTQAVGCVAMRPLDDHTAEMKRLYLKPDSRGEQLGHKLVEHICQEARRAGYARICLDTLPGMTSAQRLYQSLGFVQILPYTFNPIAGTKYLSLDL
jgi:ribosomal protein S18 acetylase RimI-like enzyme